VSFGPFLKQFNINLKWLAWPVPDYKLKESQQKTDEQLSKTIKKLDDIGRQLGKLSVATTPSN
jgi:hypothetical protein